MPSQNSDDDYHDLHHVIPDELPALSDHTISVASNPKAPIQVTSEKSYSSHLSTTAQLNESLAALPPTLSSASSEVAASYPSQFSHGDIDQSDLFFTKIMKELNSPESQKDVESTLLSSGWNDIISHMHKQLYEHKRSDVLHSIEKKILERVKQLPALESEWRQLNMTISNMMRVVKQKEEQMHILTDEIQGLVRQKSQMLDEFEQEYYREKGKLLMRAREKQETIDSSVIQSQKKAQKKK